MASSRPVYCQQSDVTLRLYSDEGSAAPSSTPQNALITDLITKVCRRFDQECSRPPGCFAPTYDVRLFSGEGFQELDVDEYATLTKIEVNLNPSDANPTDWVDVTSDFASGQIAFRPIRFWPKTSIFRMKTFFPDPYQNGNVRLTGIWGCVQPDLGATEPEVPWGPNGVITNQSVLDAMRPLDPAGNPAGWWITPEDVVHACIEWTLYAYKLAQAGYGETGGQPSAAPVNLPKRIPTSVQDVISTYARDTMHLAMIGLDGADFREELVRPGQVPAQPQLTRWSGWQTYP